MMLRRGVLALAVTSAAATPTSAPTSPLFELSSYPSELESDTDYDLTIEYEFSDGTSNINASRLRAATAHDDPADSVSRSVRLPTRRARWSRRAHMTSQRWPCGRSQRARSTSAYQLLDSVAGTRALSERAETLVLLEPALQGDNHAPAPAPRLECASRARFGLGFVQLRPWSGEHREAYHKPRDDVKTNLPPRIRVS